MAQDERADEEIAEELLALLHGEELDVPVDLPDRTIRHVQSSLTARDLIDLTTVVFILRFCAPILDLVAAMFGSVLSDDGRTHDE